MRQIDADELKKNFQDELCKGIACAECSMQAEGFCRVERWIDIAPTIEAEPIKHGVIELAYEEYGELCSYALADELNHGEWLIDKSGSLMCSKCGTLLDEAQKPSRYCPNCGARMDGEGNESSR